MITTLMVINKAGGLIYRRDFVKSAGVRHKDNDYLVLAGTFHSVHAIAAQVSPELKSSGIETLEADSFNLYCFQTLTGIKFLAVAPPDRPNVDVLLRKIYEVYADYVLKNPFYIPEMPIHCEQFDLSLQRLLKV